MDKTLFVKVRCMILVTSPTAREEFGKIAKHFYADDIKASGYRCSGCGFAWDDDPRTDFWSVTCSNCYSDSVALTEVRLGFENWGEQNGGEREQRERFDLAERELSARFSSDAPEAQSGSKP